MATHSCLIGRTGRHRQTQPSETVRTVPLLCPTYRLKFPKPRRNSITLPIVYELVAAYELFDRDDRVRVVVLTADHTAYAFCSGVKFHWHTLRLVTALNDCFSTLGGYYFGLEGPL